MLEANSEFIEALVEQLEQEGIHLTNDLLTQILAAYEERKFSLVKDVLESVLLQEGLPALGEGGPSVIQVVLDGNRSRHEEDLTPETEDNMILDSPLVM